jgi:hypothetical protein
MQQERPNRESFQDPAEGSREKTTGGSELSPEAFGERNRHGFEPVEHQDDRETEAGGGVSNRPIEEEIHNQENVPPRGERKDVEREMPDSGHQNPVKPGDDARTRTEI